jgi:hypothetical protein
MRRAGVWAGPGLPAVVPARRRRGSGVKGGRRPSRAIATATLEAGGTAPYPDGASQPAPKAGQPRPSPPASTTATHIASNGAASFDAARSPAREPSLTPTTVGVRRGPRVVTSAGSAACSLTVLVGQTQKVHGNRHGEGQQEAVERQTVPQEDESDDRAPGKPGESIIFGPRQFASPAGSCRCSTVSDVPSQIQRTSAAHLLIRRRVSTVHRGSAVLA